MVRCQVRGGGQKAISRFTRSAFVPSAQRRLKVL
jgi:hypothetical protein